MNLIRKEVIPMTKETKKQHEEKKTEFKSNAKGSCGCGCLPSTKTK